MATRFYLPSSGAADVTPSIGGTWTASGSQVIRKMSPTKTGASNASVTLTVDFSSGTASTLYAQYVSDMLAAQTISGNVAGQMRMNVSNTSGCTAVSRISVHVINSAGTVVATLLSGTSGSSSLPNVLTNKSTPASTALSSYGCANGDRICVEIGIIRTAGITSRNGLISFGDVAATDLAVDNSTTAGNSPWIEFSGDIIFFTGSKLAALGVG